MCFNVRLLSGYLIFTKQFSLMKLRNVCWCHVQSVPLMFTRDDLLGKNSFEHAL